MAIKAIQTQYNGYRFRSRLEARWAVFFDALEIEYQYEPEGFDLGALGWYLPDFWFPNSEYWLEIKGGCPTENEINKVKQLQIQSEKKSFLIFGDPWAYEQAKKGRIGFDKGGTQEIYWWKECPICHQHIWQVMSDPLHCIHPEYVDIMQRGLEKIKDDLSDWRKYRTDAEILDMIAEHLQAFNISSTETCVILDFAEEFSPLQHAYCAARSARFEHGKTPMT